MGTLKLINGDLFASKEKYIAHQCNCVTQKAAHLAKSMFDRFPYANIYKERILPWTPPVGMQMGDIIVRGNGEDQRFVINMLAQYYPGSPKYSDSSRDGFIARKNAFQECLNKISEIPELTSIGLPFGIGCGAAGGDWLIYRKMIKNFSEKADADVVIYKLI